MPCLLDHRCQLKQDVHLDCRIYLPSPWKCGGCGHCISGRIDFLESNLSSKCQTGPFLKQKKILEEDKALCVPWYKRKAAWRSILAAPGGARWGSLLTEGTDPAVDMQCPVEQKNQEAKAELGISRHPEILQHVRYSAVVFTLYSNGYCLPN